MLTDCRMFSLLLSTKKQYSVIRYQGCIRGVCVTFQDYFSHKIVRHINGLFYDTVGIADCVASGYSSVYVSLVCCKEMCHAFISFPCALTALSVFQCD